MRKSLEAIVAKLQTHLEAAEKLAVSDVETTAEKYDHIARELSDAINAINNALYEF